MKVFQKRISLFLAILLTLSTLMVVPFTASAEETATKDWYKEDAKVLEVGSYADLLAFAENAASITANQTVLLTADINMAGKTWTPISTFSGNIDGDGHTLNGLTVSSTSHCGFIIDLKGSVEITNIAFTNANVNTSSTSAMVGVVAARVNQADSNVTFENVYVHGAVGKGYSGGFIGQIGTASVVNFNKCVSNVTIDANAAQRNGGFVAIPNVNGITINMTDCAYIGPAIPGRYSAGLIGYSKVATLNLTRCVVAASYSNTAANGNSGQLFSQIAGATAIGLVDCYVLSDTLNLFWAQATTSNGTKYYVSGKMTAKYGSAVATTIHESGNFSDGAVDELAALKTVMTNNNAFLVSGDTVNLTKAEWDKADSKYKALKDAGWVMTGRTVEYATGKTVPEIMPATVAAMISSPMTISYWQVKAGTTNDFRFVSKINFDALYAYDAVGYEVTVKVQGADKNLVDAQQVSTTTVYTSITTNEGTKTAAELEAKYLVALSINGFKTADTTYEVTIVTFVKCGDTIIRDYDNALTGTITGNTFTKA